MSPYEKAVYRDAAEAVAQAMARAARETLAKECAGVSDAIAKNVFGAAVVFIVRELDEARMQRAISVALAEKQS